jgi:hypothetical protein
MMIETRSLFSLRCAKNWWQRWLTGHSDEGKHPASAMTGLLNRLYDRLSSLLLKPKKLTVNSTGQHESEVPPETIQQVMEWLFASLMHAGYCGQSHFTGYTLK